MGARLHAGPSPDIVLNHDPVLPVDAQRLDEAPVFLGGPFPASELQLPIGLLGLLYVILG